MNTSTSPMADFDLFSDAQGRWVCRVAGSEPLKISTPMKPLAQAFHEVVILVSIVLFLPIARRDWRIQRRSDTIWPNCINDKGHTDE